VRGSRSVQKEDKYGSRCLHSIVQFVHERNRVGIYSFLQKMISVREFDITIFFLISDPYKRNAGNVSSCFLHYPPHPLRYQFSVIHMLKVVNDYLIFCWSLVTCVREDV
jgi:hypothetical protein